MSARPRSFPTPPITSSTRRTQGRVGRRPTVCASTLGIRLLTNDAMSKKLVVESREQHQELTGIGATENEVDIKDTVPQRIDKVGTKVEEIAGTGDHDAPGG